MQGSPCQPTGTLARHVTPLAALLSGMVGSKRTPLPHIAAPVPDGPQPESRGTRLARWLKHDRVTDEVECVPFAEALVRQLAWQTLVLVMEGSVVGRGCVALLLHVVEKGRAVPLAWQVRHVSLGPVPEDLPIALVTQGPPMIPAGASGVLLGDGAVDGTRLPPTVHAYRWSYVVRTGSHLTVVWEGEHFRCETVASCSKPGTLVALREARVTEAA